MSKRTKCLDTGNRKIIYKNDDDDDDVGFCSTVLVYLPFLLAPEFFFCEWNCKQFPNIV